MHARCDSRARDVRGRVAQPCSGDACTPHRRPAALQRKREREKEVYYRTCNSTRAAHARDMHSKCPHRRMHALHSRPRNLGGRVRTRSTPTLGYGPGPCVASARSTQAASACGRAGVPTPVHGCMRACSGRQTPPTKHDVTAVSAPPQHVTARAALPPAAPPRRRATRAHAHGRRPPPARPHAVACAGAGLDALRRPPGAIHPAAKRSASRGRGAQHGRHGCAPVAFIRPCCIRLPLTSSAAARTLSIGPWRPRRGTNASGTGLGGRSHQTARLSAICVRVSRNKEERRASARVSPCARGPSRDRPSAPSPSPLRRSRRPHLRTAPRLSTRVPALHA